MKASSFLDSLTSLPEDQKARLAAKYSSWDAQTRSAADKRVSYLLKLSVDSPASSVAEEIEHGSEHTACFALLHTLRGWAEARIKDRLRAPTYAQHIDEAGTHAIEKFRNALSGAEQMLVLRAFAIEMMEGIGLLLEHGVDDSDCPVNWSLVNPATGGKVAGELHAYFDGDPEDDHVYMPRLPA
jgi:hypothetical protein